MRRSVLALVIACGLLVAHAGAQPAVRRATTIAALRSYPGFYHQQTVSVIGAVTGDRVETALLASDEATISLVVRELPREGKLEARGQFLDIGRMSQEDPRLIPFNLVDRISQMTKLSLIPNLLRIKSLPDDLLALLLGPIQQLLHLGAILCTDK